MSLGARRWTPLYRKLILSGDLTPVSQLSGAFPAAPSAVHLQFAYFESSLVVQYLVEQYGQDMINRILTDLGVGMPINDSLHAIPDRSRHWTRNLNSTPGSSQTDSRPMPLGMRSNLRRGCDTRRSGKTGSSNIRPALPALQRYAAKLIEAKEFAKAEKVGRQLVDLCPQYYGPQSGYALLGIVYRQQQ